MPPKTAASASTAAGTFYLPLAYRLFFLFVEPVAALVGAYYAHFRANEYRTLIDAASTRRWASSAAPPRGTQVALSQLAYLSFFFAVNEALVLRSTADLGVWRTVLAAQRVGDLGHLYASRPLGLQVYYEARAWNIMDSGSVPFVYLGAAMRIAFLLGVGLGGRPSKTAPRKATVASPTKKKKGRS